MLRVLSRDRLAPTGLKTIGHIFVSEKSDFYEITDDIPQFQESSNGKISGDTCKQLFSHDGI